MSEQEGKRRIIHNLLDAGLRKSEIAGIVAVDIRTVRRIYNDKITGKGIERRPGSGGHNKKRAEVLDSLNTNISFDPTKSISESLAMNSAVTVIKEESEDDLTSDRQNAPIVGELVTYTEPTVFAEGSSRNEQGKRLRQEGRESCRRVEPYDADAMPNAPLSDDDDDDVIELDGDEPSEKVMVLEKGARIRALTSQTPFRGLPTDDFLDKPQSTYRNAPSPTMTGNRSYVDEVFEVKAAMRLVYENVRTGRLTKAFKEKIFRSVEVSADWPWTMHDYDAKHFVPEVLRDKGGLQIESHIRAAVFAEQREKRTAYAVNAGADEILAILYKPDPAGLREMCCSLAKRVTIARGWGENGTKQNDIYKMIIDLDVDQLLVMARELEDKRPKKMKQVFKTGDIGSLRSSFVMSTLEQLKVTHRHPFDVHSMNVRWIVPIELVTVPSAVDAICSRIKVAVEVAQLNERVNFFITYHAKELLNTRVKSGRSINEAIVTKMLTEMIAVDEWNSNVPSVSVLIARIEGTPTQALYALTPCSRGIRTVKTPGGDVDEAEEWDHLVVWEESVGYSFS